jgi:translocation-and-assembly-module (TAM) inner membrane subunit TamB-like protein
MPAPRAARGSRVRRWARALVWSAAFVLVATLAASWYVQRPSFRAAALARLELALRGAVRGSIELEGLEQLGLSGARLRRLRVIDEQGRRVLELEDIGVRFGLLGLLGAWLLEEPPVLRLQHIRVERSRLRLATEPQSGELTLLRALQPPAREPSSTAGSEARVVALPAVELGEVLVSHEAPALKTLELRIERVHGQAMLGGDRTTIAAERFGLSLRAGAERWVDGAGSFSLASAGGPLAVGFHGFVRGTELDAHVELGGGQLSGSLDVPHATPEAVRRAWPSWPIRVPVALRLAGRGPLDAVAIDGRATLDRSSLELGGSVDLTRGPRALLQLQGHALDARVLSEAAPSTAIEAHGQVELSPSASGLRVDATVDTEATSIGSVALPPAQLGLRSEAGTTTARASLADARGRLELTAELAPDATARLEARATRVALAALTWGAAVGEVELAARARLVDGALSGSLSGRSARLASGPLEVAAATLEGSFGGAVTALGESRLELTAAGEDVRLGPARLERARLHARGTWHDSRIDATLESRAGPGRASARLELRPEPRFSELELALDGAEVSLSATASEWSPARGRLDVERMTLAGKAGALHGSLQRAPSRLALALDAERLDAARLCRAFGVVAPAVSGVWSGKISLAAAGAETRGELALHAEKVRVRDVAIGALGVRATIAGAQVELGIDAADPSLGELALRGAAELGGPPLELGAWRRATGSGSITLTHLPLWPIGLALGGLGPLRELEGTLAARATLERSDATELPSLLVEAGTEALSFRLAPEVGGGTFEHHTLRASARFDGPSGRTDGSVRVEDANGALVSATGVLSLDLPALLREPGAITRRVLAAPLDALVRVHPRAVGLLPAPLGARDLSGNVEATAQLRGSLDEPRLSLAARARDLLGSVSDSTRAVDVSGRLEYAPRGGRVQATADVVQAGQRLVVARLEGSVPPLLELPARLDEVELRAAAMLNGVPLELWPRAARERLEARLYGSVELQQGPATPGRQRAHIEIANLSAFGQRLGNGRLTLEHDEGGLRADLRIGSREHFLHASARSAAPGSEGGAVEGSLSARDFDAASLSPLTSGLLSRLSGAMNADLDFALRPTGPSDWYLGIDGTARVRGGSAHIEELGLEIRDIDASVRARSTPDHTVLLIDPLSAKARSRTANIKGDAEVWFRGLRVENAEANLTLADVPLSLKGVSRGIARGNVKARLERLPEHLLALEVDIPELRVRLPASSTRTLIALDENPELRVLQSVEPPEQRDPEALRWMMRFDLGRNVRIQRGDLDVPLSGHPMLEYQYEVRPSGTIEAAPGGRIRLFNQSFNIDRGIVQLDPSEPDNPRVDVTASWRAPDGTTIYVDVTGRANDATVLTRDDRGLQDVERFYLITGGALAEGPRGTDGNAAEAAALGQTVSLGINELLRNAIGNVAVSIGATADDRASYSASVRLTDKLTFQGSFLPASENSLEESTNDLTGTLDYRFSRRWSLRTELGTSGGAFDLLWSHRY